MPAVWPTEYVSEPPRFMEVRLGNNSQVTPVDTGKTQELIMACLAAGDKTSADMWLCAIEKADQTRSGSNKDLYLALNRMCNLCAKAGNAVGAGWCADRMMSKGFRPKLWTINSVIDACAKAGDVTSALEWWKKLAALGHTPNDITYNTMIKACAQTCDVPLAEWWMQKMIANGLNPSVVSFSILINAFAQSGSVDNAESCFWRMRELGVEPDTIVYNSLINACARATQPDKAERWFMQMQTDNKTADVKTYNSLINACARSGSIERAEYWFQHMERAGIKANSVTFGSMMYASAKKGDLERAEHWIGQMLYRGEAPNLVCFNTVMHACASAGDTSRAKQWFRMALDAGTEPNAVSYNNMVNAFAVSGEVDEAKAWLQQMVVKGLHPDRITHATLCRAYTHACQNVEQQECSFLSYNAIISAYMEVGDLKSAHRWISEMQTDEGASRMGALRMQARIGQEAQKKALTTLSEVRDACQQKPALMLRPPDFPPTFTAASSAPRHASERLTRASLARINGTDSVGEVPASSRIPAFPDTVSSGTVCKRMTGAKPLPSIDEEALRFAHPPLVPSDFPSGSTCASGPSDTPDWEVYWSVVGRMSL